MRWRWPRLGMMREVQILLPLALLLLVLLSTFTLFFSRYTLQLLAEARRDEARQLARSVAEILTTEEGSLELALARTSILARRTALLRADGSLLTSQGDFDSADLLAPLEGQLSFDATAVGPNAALPEVVAGFARLVRRQQKLIVRIDLPAAELAAQRRGVNVLLAVALPINALVTIFVLFFLRHLLTPYEQLLARARQLESPADPAQNEDEVSFLLTTFETAMTALARSRETEPQDEIDSLQRALAPSLESGVLLLSDSGEVLALNPFGAAILGISTDLPARPVEDFLTGQPELASVLRGAVATGEGIQRSEVPLEVHGEPRILGLTVHALRRDDGSARGFLVLFVDLTEVQQQAEEERISRTLAELAELAAGIAHELRNGIATLRGYLTLIEREPAEAMIGEYLAEIRRESDRMERVLRDFLTFATPGSLQSDRVSLAEIVGQAARAPMLAGCEVTVEVEAGADALVVGDRQLLEQAVRNLLRNAVEAQAESETATRVDIRLRRGADGIELIVDDRGPGVPADVRGRLFQPFVSGRPEGVGLGLSLTHRIASLHGGTLRLLDRPNGGTSAVLSLPSDAIVT